MYKRLCKGLNDYGQLLESNKINELIDSKHDWYESVYFYNESQYKQFQENNTVAGIQDVVTNRIIFDFDNEDLNIAKREAKIVIDRLTKYVGESNLEVYFSGNKGFHVEFTIDKYINPLQVKSFVNKIAKDVFIDPKVYNANRIFRIPGTKNQKSGLYKIPLTLNQFHTFTIEEIKERAKSLDNITDSFSWNTVHLSSDLFKVEEIKEVKKEVTEIDWSIKPKNISNCRYSLQNGYFNEGDRNSALLCLAATYKNQGFQLEHTYRLLKGVAELQAKQNECERYPDDEIYNNIILQVYSDTWKNGQFSCKQEGSWLNGYCLKLGQRSCKHDSTGKPIKVMDIAPQFKDYVKNIDNNTIKTGIKSIDDNVFISTGANVCILGAPGSGKSSIALNILSNTSKAGVPSVFASFDMAKTRMYEKILYKVTGMSREQIYGSYQQDEENEIMEKVKQEFENVYFFQKSVPTVEDLRNYILDCQEQRGEKIKLVVVDYFERVASDVSDDTASSKKVAGELQDLVNDLNICLITFYQPNKQALVGGIDSPIYDYTKIKGSSYIYQACRLIFSIWRPYYNVKNSNDDNYLQMAVLKNDFGNLNEFTFKWNGKRGEIHEMEDSDFEEFDRLMSIKEHNKKPDNDW